MKFGSTRFRALGAAALIVALGTTLVACGGDDDDDDAASTDTTAAQASGDLTELCDVNVKIASATPAVFMGADPEEVKAAYADSGLDALFDQAVALDLPAEIADQLTEAVAILRKAGETGDTSPMADFDTTPIDAYFHDNCDYQQVEVSAKDYEFANLPDSLDAGATSFKVTNDGEDLHEMIVVGKAPGTTESFDEILDMPEEEANTNVAPVNGTVVEVGKSGYFAADLAAGDYLAICFIPQGTKTQSDEVDGPPHFTLGMKKEFTVS